MAAGAAGTDSAVRWRGRRHLGGACLSALFALSGLQACSDGAGLPGAAAGAAGAATPEALFADRRSGVWIEVAGQVVRLLPDDARGARHQRFILELASGHTLLVVHNIDVAPRVPGLEVGARVRVRGEYEWNDKGGLVHWTHHDPDGHLPGGWVEHAGRRHR